MLKKLYLIALTTLISLNLFGAEQANKITITIKRNSETLQDIFISYTYKHENEIKTVDKTRYLNLHNNETSWIYSGLINGQSITPEEADILFFQLERQYNYAELKENFIKKESSSFVDGKITIYYHIKTFRIE